MSKDDFHKRMARLGVRPDTLAGGPSPRSHSSTGRNNGFRLSRVVLGALCSAIVFFLFNNTQKISDAAPQSVRDSDTPGLFGAPIAVLTIAWFAIIPLWFVGTVTASAMRGRSAPRPFVVGAFPGLAAGLALMQLP